MNEDHVHVCNTDQLTGRIKYMNLQMPLAEYDMMARAIGVHQFKTGEFISRSEYIRMAIREKVRMDLGEGDEDGTDGTTVQTQLEVFDHE